MSPGKTTSVSTAILSVPYVLNLVSIFAASITMTMFMPLLPLYIVKIGGDVSMAGFVVSIFTIAALLCRPFFAIIVDKKGRKLILSIGFALIVAGCLSYSFISVIGLLIAARVVHGAGYSASTNATGAIVADLLPPERRVQGIGYYGFVMAASIALGPAFALLIYRSFGLNAAFMTATSIGALGLIASLLMRYEPRLGRPAAAAPVEGPGAAKRGLVGGILAKGYEKSALPASVVMFFVAMAYGCVVTFLASYAKGLGLADVSLYFVVYAVVLLATRVVVDRLTKKRDISVVLVPGIALMAVAFAILGSARSLPYFIVAAVFYGLGYGAVQPTLNAMVLSRCEPTKRGAANGTFFSALDLGIGLGAFVGGIVCRWSGFPAMYFGCIGLMALAAVASASRLSCRGPASPEAAGPGRRDH